MSTDFKFLPVSGGGIPVLPGTLAPLGQGFKFLSADSSNTQADGNITTVTDLQFAADADSHYLAEYFLRVHTDAVAVPVIQNKPSYPTGIVSAYLSQGGLAANNSNVIVQPPTNGQIYGAYTGANNSDYTECTIALEVITGASAGNISYAFSAVTGGSTPTSIMAGSFVRITKLR